MIGSPANRASRRRSGWRSRTATAAGAAATAVAVGLTAAPSAQAITVNRDYTWDPVYASGLYAGLLELVSNLLPGVNAQLSENISFQTGPPPALGLQVEVPPIVQSGLAVYANVGLTLNLRAIAGGSANLYNTVAGLPEPGCGKGGAGDTGAASYASNCRYAIQLATLGSELDLINAYRDQVASVRGDTQSGLIPFTSAPTSTSKLPTQTNQALVILQNPLRPNGGIAARFPGIAKALGIDPVMPDAGRVASESGKVVLNTTTLDLTWAYDPIGDFPAVFSPFAIANSLSAALPLNIVTGGLAAEPLQGATLGDIGLNLASLLQFPLDVTAANIITIYTLKMVAGQAFYATLVPNELPITAAIGLPGTVANFALGALNAKFKFGNPVGDALAGAMKIWVNTAYTDVLTPDKLGSCATGCGSNEAKTWAQLGYQAYDRTFGAYAAPLSPASASTQTPFGTDPLTPEEKKAANDAAWTALVEGIKAQFAKPFWGIIEPVNQAQSAATAPKAANTVAAVKPAAATPATDPIAPPAISAPEPVVAPVEQESAPAPAPAADPAPTVDLSGLADDPAPAPAPRVTSHRSVAAVSSGDSDTSSAPQASSGSTGRHRGAN